MKIPSPELVAEAFLRTKADDTWGITTTLPALQVNDGKGLPKDNWGGKKLWVTPRGYGTAVWRPVPIRETFAVIVIWCKPVDKRRQWGSAVDLGQELMDLGTDWYTSVALDMPYTGYRSVLLTSFLPTSDVRRIENDPQGLARVEFDVKLTYDIKL